MYSQASTGGIYTKEFKVYVKSEGIIVSPFHDIPLHPVENKDIVSVINEIPRFENAKFEISKEEKMNPVMQDTKKGKMRYVPNIFPSKGYPWNYGSIPQTWEDPESKDEFVDKLGDNDPVDVIEIGKRRKKIGEVYQGKVLGCLGLIDKGECDWKVLLIDKKDENASLVNDIEDIKKVYPGLLDLTFRWFRDYKIPSGSPPNIFGLDGEFKGKDVAMKVIRNAHLSWKRMMEGSEGGKISKCNARIEASPHRLDKDLVIEIKQEEAGKVPGDVYEYYFVGQSGKAF